MNKKLLIGITAPQSVVLIKNQLKYFKANNYDVFLLAPRTELTISFCNAEGATLIGVNMEREISPVKDLISFFKILKKLRELKPDIVNLGTPKVSLLGLTAARLLGVKKRVYTCRGFRFEHESGRFKNLLVNIERFTSKMATDVICISQSVKDLGMKNKIFSENKSHVINYGSSNGVDLDMFNQNCLNKNKLDEIKSIWIKKKCFYFGYVGRLINRKGFKELFEAFKIVYNKNKETRLLIVGKPYFDQFDESLFKEVINHPGVVNVGLVPFDDVPYYMYLINVFVLPAYWEGFGNVLVQAAAMGKPIISTNATGCKDAVKDKFNGELIEKGDITALKETMIKFYNDQQLTERYSQNSLRWSKNFEPELIWKGMDNIYSL